MRIDNKGMRIAICGIMLAGGLCVLGKELLWEYHTEENEIDASFTDKYSFADAYVIVSSASLHVAPILSYYEPETIIYGDSGLQDMANPYSNIEDFENFMIEDNKTVILFVNSGDEIPERFARKYSIEYIGKLIAEKKLKLLYGYLLTS